jgi:hypothetical protein
MLVLARFDSRPKIALLTLLLAIMATGCGDKGVGGLPSGGPSDAAKADAGGKEQLDAAPKAGEADGHATPSFDAGGPVADATADGASLTATEAGGACIPDGLRCDQSGDGGTCCGSNCSVDPTSGQGYCGSCIAEGLSCSGNGGFACCGVECNTMTGSCGTNECVPDTMPCNQGQVCCNDDCNGTTCGGN